MRSTRMEAHPQPTTSTIVEEVQPAPAQEASTSQQAIQPPHPTATTAEQHLRLILVPKKKKKKKVRWATPFYVEDTMQILYSQPNVTMFIFFKLFCRALLGPKMSSTMSSWERKNPKVRLNASFFYSIFDYIQNYVSNLLSLSLSSHQSVVYSTNKGNLENGATMIAMRNVKIATRIIIMKMETAQHYNNVLY